MQVKNNPIPAIAVRGSAGMLVKRTWHRARACAALLPCRHADRQEPHPERFRDGARVANDTVQNERATSDGDTWSPSGADAALVRLEPKVRYVTATLILIGGIEGDTAGGVKSRLLDREFLKPSEILQTRAHGVPRGVDVQHVVVVPVVKIHAVLVQQAPVTIRDVHNEFLVDGAGLPTQMPRQDLARTAHAQVAAGVRQQADSIAGMDDPIFAALWAAAVRRGVERELLPVAPVAPPGGHGGTLHIDEPAMEGPEEHRVAVAHLRVGRRRVQLLLQGVGGVVAGGPGRQPRRPARQEPPPAAAPEVPLRAAVFPSPEEPAVEASSERGAPQREAPLPDDDGVPPQLAGVLLHGAELAGEALPVPVVLEAVVVVEVEADVPVAPRADGIPRVDELGDGPLEDGQDHGDPARGHPGAADQARGPVVVAAEPLRRDRVRGLVADGDPGDGPAGPVAARQQAERPQRPPEVP
eukprot:CAMPEP_0179354372 /NCGR_PEP_ID=MMETSP0797-20121207/76815_1 /TAXON_ID=47934 /ORGANISM="Dinophysis acuminata, Strain DAEP01" /LENGTH=468 /DNA_ID=CAMNT_0021069469 /DNA_START=23 /DNA_END=1426 /DNA_ORIENTATION=+